MTIKLIESDSSSKGVKARMRIIKAGLGSSGYYSAKVLERDGAQAFPSGTHLFFDHQTENERWDRGGARSIRDLVGKTLSEAQYDPDEESLFADVLFYNGDADRIKAIAEDVGVSIEASGARDEESGEVTELLAHPNNRIALTPVAGREGEITQFYESFTASKLNLIESGKIEESDNEPEKDNLDMKPEDISAIVDAVKAALEPRIAQVEEALKPEEVEAPAIAEVIEALIEADLPEGLRTRVYEAKDPLAELETIKAIKESLADKAPKGEVKQPGHIQESAGGGENFLTSTWGGRN